MQVLDAVAGALIGAFTWLNLGSIAPAVCWVYRKQAVVSLASSLLTLSLVALSRTQPPHSVVLTANGGQPCKLKCGQCHW